MEGRDNRMSSDEFRNAISIVANNDLKDQICKQGTAQFARDTGQRLLWSYAVDMVKNVDLAERADLRERQNDWLQYADNKCDGLLGGLPLAIGELHPELCLAMLQWQRYSSRILPILHYQCACNHILKVIREFYLNLTGVLLECYLDTT